MPRMNGLEATETIRVTDTVTPVVAVTASVEAEDVKRCREAGMNDFLGKPLRNNTVMALVKQYSIPTKEVTIRKKRKKKGKKGKKDTAKVNKGASVSDVSLVDTKDSKKEDGVPKPPSSSSES